MKTFARWSRPFLILALIGGLGLRLAALAARQTLSHDEAISLLAATGHQGEYEAIYLEGLPPLNTWVEARSLQRFLQPEEALVLGRIATDLARADSHPPLYFWLLHLWLWLVGGGLGAGLALNLLIDLGTAALLLRFGNRVLYDPAAARIVAGLWLLSPVSLQASAEVRHYALLGLITLGWALALFHDLHAANSYPARLRAAGLLLGMTVAGLLTHYAFIPIALGGAAAASAWGWRRDRRRALWLAAIVILAGGATLLLDPAYLLPWLRAHPDPVTLGIGPRTARAAFALSQFAIDEAFLYMAVDLAGGAWGWLAALLAVSGLALIALLRRAEPPAAPDDLPARAGGVPFVAAGLGITALAIVGPYLLGLTPAHAMAARYLTPVGVFAAFVPVLLGRLPALARYRARLWQIAAALLLLSAVGRGYRLAASARPSGLPAEVAAVVIDSTARGELLPVVSRLPPEVPIFAASQASLLADPAAWLPRLAEAPTLLINASTQYGNTPEGFQALLDQIRAAGLIPGAPFELWDKRAAIVLP